MHRESTLDTRIINKHRTLVEKSKLGDRKAQYSLYNQYVDAMFNVCMRMLRNQQDAEDVLQDSFVDAFNKLDSFRYESSFGSWLKKIVINHCLNFIKRSKRVIWQPLENYEYGLADQEDVPEPPHDIRKVRAGIEQLPDGYRQIIYLYLIEGYDHNEISEITGISVSTSKSQYHRGKKRLIEIVKSL